MKFSKKTKKERKKRKHRVPWLQSISVEWLLWDKQAHVTFSVLLFILKTTEAHENNYTEKKNPGKVERIFRIT